MSLQSEVESALREVYEQDTPDEACVIDGQTIPGSLGLDASPIDLASAGWNEKVTATFVTLKSYFTNLPSPMTSTLSYYDAKGKRTVKLQIKEIQGRLDNRASLILGAGRYEK